MQNVIQVHDHYSMLAAVRARSARDAVGRALARKYPKHPWHVSASEDGSTVRVTCPAISAKYGMVIHCTGDTLETERKATRMAGELLERFRVSRTSADFSGVKRKVSGEARGAELGEAP